MNTEVNMKSKQTQQCNLDILLNQFLTDKNFYFVFFFFLSEMHLIMQLKWVASCFMLTCFMLSLKM